MGLFDFFKRLLGGGPPAAVSSPLQAAAPPPAAGRLATPSTVVAPPPAVRQPASARAIERARERRQRRNQQPRRHILLRRLNYESSLIRTPKSREVVKESPYLFAFGHQDGGGRYLDQSKDADQRWLDYYGLPSPSTPAQLATWLGLPLGKLAWLACHDGPPPKAAKAHYHFRWIAKRSGGMRLLEAPKPELKRVQEQVLRQILDKVPTHPAAHGFVSGRSILSNAAPHVGQRFVLKIDLQNFYGTVKYDRVAAIFRALGYSRVVAIWLARLTTSEAPFEVLRFDRQTHEKLQGTSTVVPHGRHLPQGASTSPALANLSAFGLDVRLSGMARAYGMTYTRYADDLTFSGPGVTFPALREFVPLVKAIIRSERFVINQSKTRITRNNQRQSVTGVVVNSRVNVSRKDFDQLKALLHNCRRHGSSGQNRAQHPNFEQHLRGRIAHVTQLNPARGAKLTKVFQLIDWKK